MNKVVVNINGSEYPMVGEKSESHMLSVARYVDNEMRNCTQKNPKLSTSAVAVLVAINITDQLFECGEENDRLFKEKEELNKKVGTTDGELKLEIRKLQLQVSKRNEEKEELNKQIEELNKVIEKQREELSQVQKEFSLSNESTNELKDKIEELINNAEEAEKKAKIAEKMASKFQNDAYKVQLEKIEIENELKYLRANR